MYTVNYQYKDTIVSRQNCQCIKYVSKLNCYSIKTFNIFNVLQIVNMLCSEIVQICKYILKLLNIAKHYVI